MHIKNLTDPAFNVVLFSHFFVLLCRSCGKLGNLEARS